MINFFILPYGKRKYWSKTLNRYVTNDYMPAQVWEHENIPLTGQVMNIYDMVNLLKLPHDGKKEHRDIVFCFDNDKFPIKEQCDINKWNGVIHVDLDNGKSGKMMALSKEQHEQLYEAVDYALQNICPDNYLYIEKSSTFPGWHMLFYFDCEKTDENFKKCAQYIYDIFRYKIDEYIENFSHIFSDPDCLKSNGKSAIFDEVYKRPYQKFYLTGIDCIIHNCSGYMPDMSDIEVSIPVKENYTPTNSYFKIEYNKNKKYDLDYNDRLYVITALKRFCRDRKLAQELWWNFAQNIKLYKKYTTKQFIDQFDKLWDKVKIEEGHIEVLKKYGFKIDDRVINYELNDDQFLGNILDDVIRQFKTGINMLVVPTGGGKTTAWIDLNKETIRDILLQQNKSILVIEPMNSIIESKYDKNEIVDIRGSKKLDINLFDTYKMVVTNYNHLVKKTFDGFDIREDIGDIFERCDMVIVDESHIMMKDVFRADVLIEFMRTLNKYADKTKIVIQTATPMMEKTLLNIKKEIIINKPLNRYIKYIFRAAGDKFDITDVICLTNYYISNGRKVYIYWKNGSYENMKIFKEIYDTEEIYIYHKRAEGSDDMKTINISHKLDNKNILISSVYFGVGNDLNDNGKTAVIIIGNNVVQEDIQAIGRWRNSDDIEVCTILLPHELEYFDEYSDFGDILNKRERYYKLLWEDKYNRINSVVVGGKTYNLKKDYYCEYFAKMDAVQQYFAQSKVKIDYLIKMGYDVRTTIKPLMVNKDWLERLKELKRARKAHRNEIIKRMINGENCYDERNESAKIDKIGRIINKMRKYDLLKYVKDLDKSTYSSFLKYETYLRYYTKEKYETSDYAELFSEIWFKDNIDNFKGKTYKVMGQEIDGNDYCMICSYMMWWIYRNKTEDNIRLKYNYYKEYVRKCLDMSKIEDDLIMMIFKNEEIDVNTNEFYKEFFNIDRIDTIKTVNKEDLFNYIKKEDFDEEKMSQTLDFCLKMIKPNELNKIRTQVGGLSGSSKKKTIISDEMNKTVLKKYNLQVGQEFESHQKLAEYTGKNINTISQWKNKGWIK